MTSDPFENHLTDWLLRKTSKGAVRRVSDLPMVLASNVGLVRTDNQDRVAIMRFSEQTGERSILVGVCDGMGGMADGALCAATALAAFFGTFRATNPRQDPKHRLMEAAFHANQSVYQAYRGGGGATLSAVLLQESSNAHWVNVGDSRIYRFNDGLNQVTVDDTLAGQLARESSTYAGRSELLQFIGVGPMIEPHVGEINSGEGSAILITTDGVHFLPASIIQELMTFATDPAVAARRLMDLASWCGGHDNASLAIVYPQDTALVDNVERSDFLEIWDPFGEVRFVNILNPEPERSSRKLPDPADDLPLPPPSTISDAVHPELEGEKKQGSLKTRRPPKKKAVSKRAASKGALADVPQLTMNFRKKESTE